MVAEAGIREVEMKCLAYLKSSVGIGALTALLLLPSTSARGQETRGAASSGASSPETPAMADEVRALSELIRGLQDQVQTLNSQLGDLRKEQERASAEARELRHALEAVKGQSSQTGGGPVNPYAVPATKETFSGPAATSTSAQQQGLSSDDRLGRLEEAQEVLEGKVNDQYQTKIESGSKYRLRLSGIALVNLFTNRGTVQNIEVPEFAQTQQSQAPLASAGSFGGTLRQSQIRIQAFGPEIAGARTSADVTFDFWGGFANTSNGGVMGLPRLRTGTVRFDWANTSIVAGQDRLFFAPLAPTSIASLGSPPLAYAGNLWSWVPQVRVEHRFVMSDNSSFAIQGGILDNLTGDPPGDPFDRYPTWGELSGQPAYAVHVSWGHRMLGQTLTVGAGGYYGRQDWGFNRTVDGWAGTTDLTLPLGKRFEFTGAFYRGRAVAGLGGALEQSVLLNGPFSSPSTTFRGLDSMGGWAQLKYRLKSNFEINGALGLDNPYAGELRRFSSNNIYKNPGPFTRNLSPLVNFIYQIRSDILFSVEYRYLDTTGLDSGSVTANHVNLSLGYIF
jgi:hypothetical protein